MKQKSTLWFLVVITTIFLAGLGYSVGQNLGVVQPSGWFNSVECGPWEHVRTYFNCEDYSSTCINDIYGYDCLTKMRYYVYERQCDVYSEPRHIYVKTTTQYEERGAVVGCCDVCTMSYSPKNQVFGKDQVALGHCLNTTSPVQNVRLMR